MVESVAYSLFCPPEPVAEDASRTRYGSYSVYSHGHRVEFLPSSNLPHNYSNNILGMAFPWENRALVSVDQDPFHRRETMEHEIVHLEHPHLSEFQVRAETMRRLKAKGLEIEAEIAAKHLEDFRSLSYI